MCVYMYEWGEAINMFKYLYFHLWSLSFQYLVSRLHSIKVQQYLQYILFNTSSLVF